MKEVNQPEPEIVQEEKKKPSRNYIHLGDEEIQDMINTYRKLLKLENPKERELLTDKIQELEKELRLRSKLKPAKD